MTIPTTTNNNYLRVDSPKVSEDAHFIHSSYTYQHNLVSVENGSYLVKPIETRYDFKTDKIVNKTGVLVVGLGGNNGSTLFASILANKNNINWNTKHGIQTPNYYGSVMMSSTVKLGKDSNSNKDIFIRLKDLVPTLHPNNLVIHGWDINNSNMFEAMKRAKVLDYDLQRQLEKEMREIVPMPSIYYKDFIALNQETRANNLIKSKTKKEHLKQIMEDIDNFKEKNSLDKVIVIWSGNTERYSELIKGVNDTADNLLNAIQNNHNEVSPSTMFAVASILTDCAFINGSPQNTLVPGAIELAEKKKVFVGGDDFKSGQTKVKSVIVDFLVNAGIKPTAITSYNHLGNNDGLNLSQHSQFKSKEISKSNVVDDMVSANHILYNKKEKPDHTVVIKYCPSVGDSKRAMDEYESTIFMNGKNTMAIYNICEDSLLATPLIIDLVILTELMERVEFKTNEIKEYTKFNTVLSILSYMLKAPLVPENTPVINSLNKQRNAIQNIIKALVGIHPENDMLLEYKAF